MLDQLGNGDSGMGAPRHSGVNTNYYANVMAGREMPDLSGKIRGGYDGLSKYSSMSSFGGMMPPQMPSFEMQHPLPARILSCREISDHIQDCPICIKFYKNDTGIHIIVIVVLSIACLLLLKMVLNV